MGTAGNTFCSRHGLRRSLRDITHRHCFLSVSVEPVRNVFLDHGMKVGAAESEGTQAGAAHRVSRHVPRLEFGVHIKRRVGEVDIRVRMLAVHAGRQDLVMKRERRLQQSRCASRAL